MPDQLQRPVVAVVDDDAAVLNALVFSLETEGFEVMAFGNGEDLIERGADRADCLIIDERLPEGSSGVDLIRRLRARRIAAPAILITSNPDAALVQSAALAGATVVEKPLLGAALSAAVQAALNHRSR